MILRNCLLVGSVVCDWGLVGFLSTCLFAMAAPLDRPLSVSLTCQGDVSARDVIYSLQSTVENGKIKCVTQTRAQSWQITFSDETTRDNFISSGLDVNGQHYECIPLSRLSRDTFSRSQDPPALVTVKMPYEMPDAVAKSLLSRYGEVTRVHRRTYAFAPDIETGVRVFTVRNPAPIESFSQSFQVGRYLLRFYVRLAGQPTRCYRCDSDQHQVKDCPHPSSYRRCYRCGQEGHIYRSCPGTSAPADSYSAQVVSRNSDADDDDDDDESWHVSNTRDLDASENEIPPVVNCEVSATPTIVSGDNAGLYSDISESVIDTASDKDQEDEMQASRISGYN